MDLKEIWNKAPLKKRTELVRTMGYKSEWGKLKYEEISKRGGGMLIRDLKNLNTKRRG